MIGIIETQQTDDCQTFATGQRDIAFAIANLKSLDSERNIEVLQVLNEVFDTLEGSNDASSPATSVAALATV